MTEHDQPQADAAALAGDPSHADAPVPAMATFSAFYREGFKPLMAFLLIQGASAIDAAEVAQDTMASAYRQWPAIRRPRAWTRTVASRNLVRRMVDARDIPVDPPPEPPVPLRNVAIDQWEQRQDLLRALRGLPHRQRQVVALYLEDLTTSEIARELEITPGAVREHLRSARAALTTHLKPLDGER